MFRSMRRFKQALPEEKCVEILERGTHGVLALQGDEGYPYAVPLSYVFSDGKIYFHCAKSGHKIDSLARSDKASFCVVDRDEIHGEEYTTYYKSVIAFGRVRLLTDAGELRRAVEKLGVRYAPNLGEEAVKSYLEKNGVHCAVMELTIEHLSGKQARELIGKE